VNVRAPYQLVEVAPAPPKGPSAIAWLESCESAPRTRVGRSHAPTAVAGHDRTAKGKELTLRVRGRCPASVLILPHTPRRENVKAIRCGLRRGARQAPPRGYRVWCRRTDARRHRRAADRLASEHDWVECSIAPENGSAQPLPASCVDRGPDILSMDSDSPRSRDMAGVEEVVCGGDEPGARLRYVPGRRPSATGAAGGVSREGGYPYARIRLGMTWRS